MKHTMGNSPHCRDCYFFKEKEFESECSGDGWCLKGLRVNGKQINDRYPTRYNLDCNNWEDAEDRITHYEALTRKVEPSRKGIERLMYEELLK